MFFDHGKILLPASAPNIGAETIVECLKAISLKSKHTKFLDILAHAANILSLLNLPSAKCDFSKFVYVLLEEVINKVLSGFTYPFSRTLAASNNSLAITTSTRPGFGYNDNTGSLPFSKF